jgi:hypothetical protein
VDVQLADELAEPGIGLLLGVGSDRDVVERDAVGRSQRREVGVVRHHGRDLDVETAGRPPEQQVVQTVPELGHHDEGPVGVARVPHLPRHRMLGADGSERRPELVGTRATADRHEVHPHEEPGGEPVLELLALDDVAAALEDVPRHVGDQPWSVRAGDGEDVLGGAARLGDMR